MSTLDPCYFRVNIEQFPQITNSSIRSFSHDSLLALIPRSPTPEPARVEESFSLDYADEVGLNITSPYESDSEESEADSDILRLRTSRRPRQRPASPLGSYLSSLSHPGSAFSDDSEGEGSDTDWEPSMVEYTGGAELTPCFSRARPESTYSDDEYDGQRLEFDERGKSGASSSWEQPETFDWESRWQSEVDDGWVTDEGDTFDEGGVLPDEMDSVCLITVFLYVHFSQLLYRTTSRLSTLGPILGFGDPLPPLSISNTHKSLPYNSILSSLYRRSPALGHLYRITCLDPNSLFPDI